MNHAKNLPATKVPVNHRIVAKFIDLLIIFFAARVLPYPFGPFLCFFYSLFADGMKFGPFNGQSIGKKAMHLQVISVISRRPCSLKESALRNAPVGMATFFAIIPIWGWLILGLIGIPLMVMEIYLMLRVESGHRLGDVMGDTEVLSIRPQARR